MVKQIVLLSANYIPVIHEAVFGSSENAMERFSYGGSSELGLDIIKK
ncbi:MAG: hypothetical protein IJ604_05820 [Prevotella sp.]|nr:hypothetical protein [Prevotella sp.]